MIRTHLRSLLVLFSPLVFSIACGDDPPVEPGAKPVVTSFTAMPTTVAPGGSTTLAWVVTGATTIKISAAPGGEIVANGAASGMMAAVVNEDTTYTLTATNDAGATIKTVSVSAEDDIDAPMIDSFTSSVMMTPPGADVVLTWTTSDATGVDISDGATNIVADGDPDGMFTVRVDETTTFTLTAKGLGTPATRDVTVTVVTGDGPIVSNFLADPTAVIEGERARLSWVVMRASEVVITDNAGVEVYRGTDLTGMQEVTPNVTPLPGDAIYTLVASNNDNQTATAMVPIRVNVQIRPTVDVFTATPPSVDIGDSTLLSWTVSNATEIEISDGTSIIHENTALTGMFTVRPLVDTTYTLTARDAAMNEGTATLTVTVNAGAPPILAFRVAPNPVAIGAAITLTWQTATATAVSILRDGVSIHESALNDSSFTTTQTSTASDYTLIVANAIGSNTETVTVYGHNVPAIETFTVEPAIFPANGSVTATITYEVSDFATLDLFMNGVPLASFNRIDVSPTTTSTSGVLYVQVSSLTDFTLFAVSAAGQQAESRQVRQLVSKVEPNDTPETATPYVIGTVATAAIDPSGDVDWYAITVPANGWLRVETSNLAGGCDTISDTQITVFSSTTASAEDQIAINDDLGIGEYCSRLTPFNEVPTATDALKNLPAGTYYVRVRASPFDPTQTFDYLFSATVGAASCGNGLYETSVLEECDDGNVSAGDGCDAVCAFEVNPIVITAPGGSTIVTLTPGGFQLVQIETSTGGESLGVVAADANGTCNVIDTAMVLTNAQFQGLGEKTGGGPTGSAGTCAAILFPADRFATDLEHGTYYVAVINESTTAGQATVTVTLNPPVCGNSLLTTNSGEECDDGNTANGDACDSNCQIEIATLPSANILTYPGGISAVGEHDFIPVIVTAETYIVASVHVPNASVACADDPSIALTGSTMTPRIASGIVNGGPNNACATVGPAVATRVMPGNYFIEVWDNGDDGIISGYQVRISSRPVDVCGNGLAEGAEFCDDGNTTSGDGCSATCAAETAVLPSALPFVYTGAISVLGESDLHPFTVTQETLIRVETFVAARPACTGDTEIHILDANMVVLGSDDDDGVNACSLITPNDTFARLLPGNYFIRINEFDNNALIGAYEIVVQSFGINVCGNFVIDSGEVCDDGNTAAGDGCSAVCQVETTCDLALTAVLGANTGNTSTSFNNNTTICDTYPQPGREQVWEFIPATSGDMTVAMQSAADLSVYVRSPSCTNDVDTLDCEDNGLGGDTETLTVPVTAGQLYFIIVDSWSLSSQGAYTVTLSIP